MLLVKFHTFSKKHRQSEKKNWDSYHNRDKNIEI